MRSKHRRIDSTQLKRLRPTAEETFFPENLMPQPMRTGRSHVPGHATSTASFCKATFPICNKYVQRRPTVAEPRRGCFRDLVAAVVADSLGELLALHILLTEPVYVAFILWPGCLLSGFMYSSCERREFYTPADCRDPICYGLQVFRIAQFTPSRPPKAGVWSYRDLARQRHGSAEALDLDLARLWT